MKPCGLLQLESRSTFSMILLVSASKIPVALVSSIHTKITSFLYQNAVLTSTSAVVRQEEQTSAEKGISQQLQVLQVQDLTQTSEVPLPNHQAKRPCVDTTEQVLHTKPESEQRPPIPVRGHSDQQPAQNSGGPSGEPIMGVGEAQQMKMEVGPNEYVNQGGTDPFWKSNSLTQATQVIPRLTPLMPSYGNFNDKSGMISVFSTSHSCE